MCARSSMIFTLRIHFRCFDFFHYFQLCLTCSFVLFSCVSISFSWTKNVDKKHNKSTRMRNTQCWLAGSQQNMRDPFKYTSRTLSTQRARKLEMKLKKFTIAFSMLRYLSMWKLVVHVCDSNVATTYFIVLVSSWNYESGKNGKRQGNAQQKVVLCTKRIGIINKLKCTQPLAHSTITLPYRRSMQRHGLWTPFAKQINLQLVFVFCIERWMDWTVAPDIQTNHDDDGGGYLSTVLFARRPTEGA